MIGSIKWNLAIAGIGSALTFLVSLSNNVPGTALVGSLFTFITLFVFGFGLRWFLGRVVGLKEMDLPVSTLTDEAVDGKGKQVDLTTPDDLAIGELLNGSTDESPNFEPLNPPRLRSKETTDPDPEEVVKAIRHMSEE